MPDPFRSELRREKLVKVQGTLLLAIFLSGLIWLCLKMFGALVVEAERVEATVVRIGTYPSYAQGDLPILTFRLDDGSIRQLKTSRADAQTCMRGMNVTLYKRGDLILLGRHGCRQVQ